MISELTFWQRVHSWLHGLWEVHLRRPLCWFGRHSWLFIDDVYDNICVTCMYKRGNPDAGEEPEDEQGEQP